MRRRPHQPESTLAVWGGAEGNWSLGKAGVSGVRAMQTHQYGTLFIFHLCCSHLLVANVGTVLSTVFIIFILNSYKLLSANAHICLLDDHTIELNALKMFLFYFYDIDFFFSIYSE